MTPEDMAQIHARAFEGIARAWSAAEFRDLAALPHVCTFGDTRSFVLASVITDEAEVLTVATDPAYQRLGLAQHALRQTEDELAARGVIRVFLEVAHDNAPATALYSKMGYTEIGRRKGYYRRADSNHADALLMQKILS